MGQIRRQTAFLGKVDVRSPVSSDLSNYGVQYCCTSYCGKIPQTAKLMNLEYTLVFVSGFDMKHDSSASDRKYENTRIKRTIARGIHRPRASLNYCMYCTPYALPSVTTSCSTVQILLYVSICPHDVVVQYDDTCHHQLTIRRGKF